MKTSRRPIKVRNLKSLKRERARLRSLCREMEEQEKDRLQYLKKHFFGMALASVFPAQHMQAGLWKMLGYAVRNAWKSRNFKTALLRITITLVEFFGVREGVRLLRKYLKKRKEKKQREKEAQPPPGKEPVVTPAGQAFQAAAAVSVNPG
jgi:hypothetical protein